MGALTTEAPKDVDTKSDSMADDSNARENRDKGDYLENLKVRPTHPNLYDGYSTLLRITQARFLCISYFCRPLALVTFLDT